MEQIAFLMQLKPATRPNTANAMMKLAGIEGGARPAGYATTRSSWMRNAESVRCAKIAPRQQARNTPPSRHAPLVDYMADLMLVDGTNNHSAPADAVSIWIEREQR